MSDYVKWLNDMAKDPQVHMMNKCEECRVSFIVAHCLKQLADQHFEEQTITKEEYDARRFALIVRLRPCTCPKPSTE